MLRSKRLHLVIGLAGTFLMLFIVVGLASAASSARDHPTAAATPTANHKIKLPMKTIGIMGPVDAAEVIKQGVDAAALAAKTLGWKTVNIDPQGDPAKMGAGMNSLVNQKVSAIVLFVIEPSTVAAGLRAAHSAGIPVFDVGAGVEPSPLFAATYWPSPPAENQLLFRRMRRDLPSGAKIATIELPQFTNARVAGDLAKATAGKLGWKIVASHDADLTNLVPDVQKATTDILNAHPDLNAIWGCCDFTVAGAVPAIRAAGKKIKVYSLHGVPSTVPLVKSGSAVAEMADSYAASFIAIDQLARHWATGAKFSKTVPKNEAFKMTIVDQSNAGKGYPFPVNKIFAPFKRRWAKLYTKAG